MKFSQRICSRHTTIHLNSRLQLWPGYNTSILRYDAGTLLNLDVSHKVMRLNTVLDILYELYNKVGQGRFYNTAVKMLVGETVLTR